MKIDYEITVDVSNADIETKKRVQDAFFRLGITWGLHKTRHAYLEAGIYTNTTSKKVVMPVLMWGTVFLRKPTHTIDQLFELAGMKTEKKLIPFDLEKALAGEPVITRDGREVTQVTLFECESRYPVYAVVDGAICSFTKTGSDYDNGQSSQYDLFMKPKTRVINGFEVPAPESESLEKGGEYYAVDVNSQFFCEKYIWRGGMVDKEWLKRGIVFLAKEDAIANAKAMLGINPHKEQ